MSKDKLLSDEELATKLIRIAKGIGKTYDDSIDAKLEQSMLNLINTQKRLYAESEKLKEQEPLIKDEKIRKVVRAWAEVNAISRAKFDRHINGFSACGDGHNLLSMISFDDFVFMFVDGEYYTIDELCGEEK